jgi:hypothetical protein
MIHKDFGDKDEIEGRRFQSFHKDGRVKMAQELDAGEFIMKPYLQERLGMAVRKELDRK